MIAYDTVSIYALINPINDKVFYIGATVCPKSRLRSHISTMNYSGTKKQVIIDLLITEYGVSPEFFILENVPISEAGYWEVFYTDLYKSFGFDIDKCIVPYSHFKERIS